MPFAGGVPGRINLLPGEHPCARSMARPFRPTVPRKDSGGIPGMLSAVSGVEGAIRAGYLRAVEGHIAAHGK